MKRGGQEEGGQAAREAGSATNPELFGDSPSGKISDLRVDAARLFIQAHEQTRMASCLADPKLADCPIVYANRAFLELTGYAQEEVIARNCRFLQGPDTDPEAVDKLRHLVEIGEYGVVDILNYRKDGTSFWNAVHVGPIYGADGSLEYLYGSQWNISEVIEGREARLSQDRITRELRHRTDNIFAVLSAIVRLSSRGADDVADLSDKLTQRIGALAIAHRVSIDSESQSSKEADLQTLVEEILAPYRSGNTDRLTTSGERVSLQRKAITPLGLSLHELATNALKYGALSVGDGTVEVSWHVADDLLHLNWIEACGPAIDTSRAPDPDARTGSGSRIIAGVLAGLKGTIKFDFQPRGLHAEICLPLR